MYWLVRGCAFMCIRFARTRRNGMAHKINVSSFSLIKYISNTEQSTLDIVTLNGIQFHFPSICLDAYTMELIALRTLAFNVCMEMRYV